jgi:lysophospholipase L1-like esterase
MQTMITLLTLSHAVLGPVDTPDFVTPEIIDRGIVSMGDAARLHTVIAKAETGEPVTIGVIGGSITQGAGASGEPTRYGNRVADWWREAFPQCETTFVNAGIGATGSDIGAHRVSDDLLAHDPDFVVIEYAVNDPNTELAAETLEGLVRQVLAHPTQPAAMLLFTMHRGGGNAQEWHSKVGDHYGLPMVSFRDAVWPEIEAGRVEWEDVEADEVHPNDAGHAICARLVAEVVDRQRQSDEDPGEPTAGLPDPLISDVFQRATLLTVEDDPPARLDGFTEGHTTQLGTAWCADEPGATFELTFEGSSCAVSHFRIKGDMGRAEAWVDDGDRVLLEGWFEAEWGGYSACAFIARDLGPGEHTLHVRLLPDRADASNGHRFEIHGVLVAGG